MNPRPVHHTSALPPSHTYNDFLFSYCKIDTKENQRVWRVFLSLFLFCYSLWLSQKIAKPALLEKLLFFPLAKRVRTSETCMECLTTRVRSHQPCPQLGLWWDKPPDAQSNQTPLSFKQVVWSAPTTLIPTPASTLSKWPTEQHRQSCPCRVVPTSLPTSLPDWPAF